MFSSLTEKFQNLFSSLRGKKVLTEENLSEVVRKVRTALLDADVSYTVASRFIAGVKEKAIGNNVLKSVSPDEQFIKTIHDELVACMGSEEEDIRLRSTEVTSILMCGLQGSGKTTQCAKLALYLKNYQKKERKILLVACDLQRPAAVEQLKKLANQIDVPCFYIEGEKDPCLVAKKALEKAKSENIDILIVDTAGRLHIDEELMEELRTIKSLVNPQEVLFVANATTGQDAVKTAQEFDRSMAITGTILTMLDSNARAGAAISIRQITQKPLKFEGIGEKVTDFRLFNPRSMADRILGMGDVIHLVKEAEKHFDQEQKEALEKKIRKASFTYEDYLRQMEVMKKMGPLKNLLKMLPGVPSAEIEAVDEKKFSKIEAIILSMTGLEREEKVELIPSRRRRIAMGSGTSIEDVNRLVKQFKQLKQFCKDMPNLKKQWASKAGTKEGNLWH